MGQRWRRLGSDQLRQLWMLWRDGKTLAAIGEAVGVPLNTVWHVVARRGGIPPQERVRSIRVLSLGEREEISRELARGGGVRRIARLLHRAPSTISREIRRHGGAGAYRASDADARAWRRAGRPKVRRLLASPRLRRAVEGRLRADWSPQQIAAWLVRAYPRDPMMRVSHEAIYRTLYVQARGALKQELIRHLRRQRSLRRSGGSRTGRGDQSGRLLGAVSIANRPAEIEDRALPGHWEGDLLYGTPQSLIATLVERQSRYVMLVRLAGRDSSAVVNALIRRVRHLPAGLMQSLTWDRGGEMANHKSFTVATDVKVYFCDPRSPWQRGSNENTNGLLRQYFPRGSDLSVYTQRELDVIAKKLNTRPRQTLSWRTPAEVLAGTVASTG